MPNNALKVKCLNLIRDVLAVMYPVSALAFTGVRLGLSAFRGVEAPPSRLADLFLRRGFRIYDTLHLGSRDGAGQFVPGFAGAVAWQVTFLVSCLCVAVLVVAVVRGLAPPRVARIVLGKWTALAGLGGWLLCWWRVNGVASIHPGWIWSDYSLTWWAAWPLLIGTALVGYLSTRKERTPLRISVYGVFLALHFGFWFVTIAKREFWWPLMLLTTVVAGRGALWFLDDGKARAQMDRQPERSGNMRGLLATAALALGVLLIIWLPSRTYLISRAKDLSTLLITLERGGGQGAAPSYSITVHGDGTVEYVGRSRVKIRGSARTKIQPIQVESIVERLDKIRFFGIDDRVFAACPDTSEVIISVSVGGRAKSVICPSCREFEPETQAEVRKTADEIDEIVGSEVWTRCDGPCPFNARGL